MASLLARCGVTLLTLARLCAAPAPTVSIPRGRPPLRPGGSGRSSPPTRGAAHDCSAELEALAGTTLRDYQLLQRLGAAPLLGGGVGFVGANAAVYRARCVAAACDASREYAVKVLFRPADGAGHPADAEDLSAAGCAVAAGSAGAAAFGSPAERTELALQHTRGNATRLAAHPALLPIYHCFVDAVEPARLPDWGTDAQGASASTGGDPSQAPRGAAHTLYLVMPLTGLNLHHHASDVIQRRLATAAENKGSALSAEETLAVQGMPVLSTIGWVGVAAQLAAGLTHLAEAEIAHRDVKFDNILLLSPDGESPHGVPAVALTDFGAALDVKALEDAELSSANPRRPAASLRVPAESALVRVAGGAARRGGNPYNLPPEVLLPSIEAPDAMLDFGGSDSWSF